MCCYNFLTKKNDVKKNVFSLLYQKVSNTIGIIERIHRSVNDRAHCTECFNSHDICRASVSIIFLQACAYVIQSTQQKVVHVFLQEQALKGKMNPGKKLQKSPTPNNSKTSRKRYEVQTVKSIHRSCRVVLSRSEAQSTSMVTTASKQVLAYQEANHMRARKSFPNSLNQNVAQQLQAIENVSLELMYENQMNKSIDRLVSSIKATFKENLNKFIGANEANIMPHICQDEMNKLKRKYAHQLADMEAGFSARLRKMKTEYESKLEQEKRKYVLAIEDAKKKQWCQGCGKEINHQMMMFCNSKCQKKCM